MTKRMIASPLIMACVGSSISLIAEDYQLNKDHHKLCLLLLVMPKPCQA